MGAAAEFRGNKLIREQLSANMRPQEFEMMSELNSLKKNIDAGKPFSGPLAITHNHFGWSIEDYTKRNDGYGFHGYKTLRDLVRQWRIVIIGYECTDGGVWIAMPDDSEVFNFN